ncbi:MAG: uncharacterized protein KVP18_004216 [Porospora cf. gigantea A]|nr:MAG: hypothetical protein KVP18_004216 [Porospora cf. gigantea A]
MAIRYNAPSLGFFTSALRQSVAGAALNARDQPEEARCESFQGRKDSGYEPHASVDTEKFCSSRRLLRADRSTAAPPLDTLTRFWKSHHLIEVGPSDLRSLVPPTELLEFYYDGLPMNITQKAFLFACVVGLGAMWLQGLEGQEARPLRWLPP